MAITIGQLRRAYSAKTTLELKRGTLWPSLCSREHEAELQTAQKVNIKTFTYPSTASYTRGDNFAATAALSITDVDFQPDQYREYSGEIYFEDEELINIGLAEKQRREAAGQFALVIDGNIRTYVEGLTYASGQVLDLSGQSEKIKNGGVEKAAGDAEIIYDALLTLSEKLEDIGARTTAAMQDTNMDKTSRPYLVVPGDIWRAFAKWALDKQLSWDMLTADVLQNGSVLAGQRYKGTIEGIDVYRDGQLAEPSTFGTNDWELYGGVREAITFAERQTYVNAIPATLNQDGPKHELHMIHRWGRLRKHANLLFRIDIGSSA